VTCYELNQNVWSTPLKCLEIELHNDFLSSSASVLLKVQDVAVSTQSRTPSVERETGLSDIWRFMRARNAYNSTNLNCYHPLCLCFIVLLLLL
jgi:hypothetical protein